MLSPYGIPGINVLSMDDQFVIVQVQQPEWFDDAFAILPLFRQITGAGYRIAMQGKNGLMILEPRT